jgi:hypothetical protein
MWLLIKLVSPKFYLLLCRSQLIKIFYKTRFLTKPLLLNYLIPFASLRDKTKAIALPQAWHNRKPLKVENYV